MPATYNARQTPQETNEKHFSLDDFNVIKLLGEGNFGKVLMVNDKNNSNAYYAMKCLRKDHVLNNDDLESIVLERDISKKGQNNSHLIKLYGTFQSEVYNLTIKKHGNRKYVRDHKHTFTIPKMTVLKHS